jgi:aminoglycoside phosphotransferase (APT) family kinase protein
MRTTRPWPTVPTMSATDGHAPPDDHAASWLDRVATVLDTTVVTPGERLQSLWSGYGEIVRLWPAEAAKPVVVKRVTPPSRHEHPRGWSGAQGQARKKRSYAVEACFYRQFAPRCDAVCRVPAAHAIEGDEDGWLFVLEDLDASGFGRRRLDREGALADRDIASVLAWLARFHTRFLGAAPAGLWATGTYWHLATRPDELGAMGDRELQAAAEAIDARLREASLQTLVHGDAKLANFCFGSDGVAAVDFQYVGGGVGVQDLAYFLGSVFHGDALMQRVDGCVDHYFSLLGADLAALRPEVDARLLERQWRALLPFAWADFERFLDGWAPDHGKRSAYAKIQVQHALARL